jgi:transcriptional regulator with XRE-family HTH domain
MRKQQKIGQVIKAARVKLELSAEDVAAKCNVSRSRVYQWESQDYVMPKNFTALANALNIPVKLLERSNGSPSN